MRFSRGSTSTSRSAPRARLDLRAEPREGGGGAPAEGWEEATTDWREQVADERDRLFDNGGPNDRPRRADDRRRRETASTSSARSRSGWTAEEAHGMWREAERAGVVHMCGFNYRFVPAVRLARELLESGELGEVVHFRARYLQSWGWEADESCGGSTARRPGRARSGTSARTSSTSRRYLVGEIAAGLGRRPTFVPGRAGRRPLRGHGRVRERRRRHARGDRGSHAGGSTQNTSR